MCLLVIDTDCQSLTDVDKCSTCLDSNSTGSGECIGCQYGYHLKDDKTECVGWYISYIFQLNTV